MRWIRLAGNGATWMWLATGLAAQELRLDDLVSEALANNPAILAAQKRYEAARQRPSQVSSLPDPMFSLGYTSSGNPLPGAQLSVSPTSAIGTMPSAVWRGHKVVFRCETPL